MLYLNSLSDINNDFSENNGYNTELEQRVFLFAVDTIKFLKNIETTTENEIIKKQLIRSGTSVGANYEEAQAACSRPDFKHKISICFKEAKESNYWLRILRETDNLISDKNIIDLLVKESLEIKKIFWSIVKNLRQD